MNIDTFFNILIRVGPSAAAILYFITSVGFFYKKDYPWGYVWLFYALANVALLAASTSGETNE